MELGRLVRHTGASKRDEGLERARTKGGLGEEGFFSPLLRLKPRTDPC